MATEDIRTLAEFYPDPVRRGQVHYAFAHSFLPEYVFRNPFGFFNYLYSRVPPLPMDPVRFIQSRWSGIFEQIPGPAEQPIQPVGPGRVFRRVSDLGMTLHELAGRSVALIRMPEPEAAPQAYYSGVVLMAPAAKVEGWPRDVQARYFTVERELIDHPGQGMLCGRSRAGIHHNYGAGVALNPEAILGAVGELVK